MLGVCQRLPSVLVAALLSTLAVVTLTLAAPAQPSSGDPIALLVVVPQGLALDAVEVDRWMDLLKRERERQRLSPQELPLLRLSMGRAQHRTVLSSLGVEQAETILTLTCRRGGQGWPTEILAAHGDTAPDRIVASVKALLQNPEPAAEASVGLLLVVSGPQDEATVRPFLEELGAFWLQRYGRVRPGPYPLASYDLSVPATAQALRQAFPELREGEGPLVALALFSDGRPQELLSVYRSLETPASLVRELSAARVQAVASRPRPRTAAVALPASLPVELSAAQEQLLLVSRLHETGQQLWAATRDDKSLRNQGPKRILLRVVEESRRYLAGEEEAYQALTESLKDYDVEPLRLERHDDFAQTASRFWELTQNFLRKP